MSTSWSSNYGIGLPEDLEVEDAKNLLTIADLMQIKKMDNEGHIRPFW